MVNIDEESFSDICLIKVTISYVSLSEYGSIESHDICSGSTKKISPNILTINPNEVLFLYYKNRYSSTSVILYYPNLCL